MSGYLMKADHMDFNKKKKHKEHSFGFPARPMSIPRYADQLFGLQCNFQLKLGSLVKIESMVNL